MQQSGNIPGYTGFKPTDDSYGGSSVQRDTGSHIPGIKEYNLTMFCVGYQGYVPGVKSENVFGESFAKTSGASGDGSIQRGFDLEPADKYKSVTQATYQDQKQLY